MAARRSRATWTWRRQQARAGGRGCGGWAAGRRQPAAARARTARGGGRGSREGEGRPKRPGAREVGRRRAGGKDAPAGACAERRRWWRWRGVPVAGRRGRANEARPQRGGCSASALARGIASTRRWRRGRGRGVARRKELLRRATRPIRMASSRRASHRTSRASTAPHRGEDAPRGVTSLARTECCDAPSRRPYRPVVRLTDGARVQQHRQRPHHPHSPTLSHLTVTSPGAPRAEGLRSSGSSRKATAAASRSAGAPQQPGHARRRASAGRPSAPAPPPPPEGDLPATHQEAPIFRRCRCFPTDVGVALNQTSALVCTPPAENDSRDHGRGVAVPPSALPPGLPPRCTPCHPRCASAATGCRPGHRVAHAASVLRAYPRRRQKPRRASRPGQADPASLAALAGAQSIPHQRRTSGLDAEPKPPGAVERSDERRHHEQLGDRRRRHTKHAVHCHRRKEQALSCAGATCPARRHS